MTVRLFEMCTRGSEFFPLDLESRLNPTTLFTVESYNFHEFVCEPDVTKINDFIKIQNLAGLFEKSDNLPVRRSFIRKLWLFKQMYEIFYVSVVLVEKKMVRSVYAKAINVLKDIDEMTVDVRMLKFIRETEDIIQKVCAKIQMIIANDEGFLKLLTPRTLRHYVSNADPYMVSKIRRLHWIEPETALIVTPKHFYFWKDFWTKIFIRNFNKKNFCIGNDLCSFIADFMPMDIRGETFLDFFRKRYNTDTNSYSRPRLFDVTHETYAKNGYACNDIKVVLY